MSASILPSRILSTHEGIGQVSPIGFGAMGLTTIYGAVRTDDESREVLKLVSIASAAYHGPCWCSLSQSQAVELGSSFIDTSNVSGIIKMQTITHDTLP